MGAQLNDFETITFWKVMTFFTSQNKVDLEAFFMQEILH